MKFPFPANAPFQSLNPRWRVRCGGVLAFGPGKADLLQAVAEHGSLSKAARAMKMSYMRAWLLVQEMHRCFAQPLVQMERGGAGGGGASLTAEGQAALALYRRIEECSRQAAKEDWAKLRALLREAGPEELAEGDDPTVPAEGVPDSASGVPAPAQGTAGSSFSKGKKSGRPSGADSANLRK